MATSGTGLAVEYKSSKPTWLSESKSVRKDATLSGNDPYATQLLVHNSSLASANCAGRGGREIKFT